MVSHPTLYDRTAELDACGIGFVADARGRASREILDALLEALRRVKHRGAVAADGKTGDGAGLLMPIPSTLLPSVGCGIGMVFLRDDADRERLAASCLEEGLDVLGWREVPVDPDALGAEARASLPRIEQLLIAAPGLDADEAERRAFRARKRAERSLASYVASLSFRTVTYKALCAADQLAAFYGDLRDPAVEVPFGVFHQRFSTNTAPSWERAQPFRLLCHNGEINAIQGNVNWMHAREGRLGSDDDALLAPVVDPRGSDSAMLDNVLELLVRGGRDVRHSLAMLVPEAWEENAELDPAVRDFYRYHSGLCEPWDGPAALVFTDGQVVGATLDRNGLRPLRYAVGGDLVVCASEAGVADLPEGPVRRGRLGPGEMIAIDSERGLEENARSQAAAGGARPVRRVARGAVSSAARAARRSGRPRTDLTPRQAAFGYTQEDLRAILRPTASHAHEPTSSMGDDTALAPLAGRARPLYSYFRQRFAQVTNPPIDHLRERFVFSLRTLLGGRSPILVESPEAAGGIELPSFLLFPDGVERLDAERLDATFAPGEGLEHGARPARRGGRGGCPRRPRDAAALRRRRGLDRAPVPMLLAVGAVHDRLVAEELRTFATIVVESDEPREVHHVACLLGYGAEAICPRLALETVAALAAGDKLGGDRPSPDEAQVRFCRAIEDGVLKVMSKMGISDVASYCGAQLFDVVGLAAEVVDRCFAGTSSRDRRPRLRRARAGRARPARAARWDGRRPPREPGLRQVPQGRRAARDRPRGRRGAPRRRPPPTRSARPSATRTAERYAALRGARERARAARAPRPARARAGRGARCRSTRSSRPSRSSGASPAAPCPTARCPPRRTRRSRSRSTGSAARRTPARAARTRRASATSATAGSSRSHPAASASRPSTRVSADELQIKIAQGSKPGEGGQLPGHKVTAEIARLRHTQPGVALISPPPHHDIYSIEDLAQLVFDLRQVNPDAAVSVKLVSEAGVGLVAAGCVKALADVVHIAGADGGTGASPLSSIKNAGVPWELGLAETQQTLVANGLRGRVRLRADGGMKTGRDVVVAALLGADEVSFGTAVLIAQGCLMVRSCHLDTCPVGIATQRPDLREKFDGDAGAGHGLPPVRRRGGARAISPRSASAASTRRSAASTGSPVARGDERAALLDLAPLLASPGDGPVRYAGEPQLRASGGELGERLAGEALAGARGREHRRARVRRSATTTARSARASAASSHGGSAPRRRPGRVRARFAGSAGQSFGAFLAAGVQLELVGEANDYVGKGMGGGRIVDPPARGRRRRSRAARQHRPLRRDRRRALLRRPRRRAVRRPQLRRDRRRRGRRRPRLRVHDGRHRRRPRQRSAATSAPG